MYKKFYKWRLSERRRIPGGWSSGNGWNLFYIFAPFAKCKSLERREKMAVANGPAIWISDWEECRLHSKESASVLAKSMGIAKFSHHRFSLPFLRLERGGPEPTGILFGPGVWWGRKQNGVLRRLPSVGRWWREPAREAPSGFVWKPMARQKILFGQGSARDQSFDCNSPFFILTPIHLSGS